MTDVAVEAPPVDAPPRRPAEPRRSGSAPTVARRRTGAWRNGRPARIALGAVGIGTSLALWELVGRSGLAGSTWPPLTTVVDTMVDPAKRPLLRRAVGATVGAAARGFVFGTVAAFAAAMTGVLVPPLRAGLDRLAAVLHALPIIALAPLFIVTVGRTGTPVAIATLATFFTMFVASSSALSAARPGHHELFTVAGASGIARFVHLELPAALPGITDGLRMAAPAAVLGTVLGEWFGAPRGVGLLIVSAMQNYQIPLLWTAALLGAIVSMACYGLLSLVAGVVGRRFGGAL